MRSSSVRRWVPILVPVGGVVIAVSLGKRRLERETASRIDVLRSAAETRTERTYRNDDITDLPAPVRRYFETVLEEGQPYAQIVELAQRGAFRLGGRDGSWKPMTATQHYTADPPGFVWDADIEMFPLISVRVVDAYEFGDGSLRAMILSTVPVVEAEPCSAMNESELQRYLGEAVWFPTALLPAAGVEWRAIDDRSARVTIEDQGNTASLVFHFDEEGLVERVTATERYRQETSSFAPWTGYFENYQWHDGMQIPATAAVEWNLPDGGLPYWRAHITSTDHRYS